MPEFRYWLCERYNGHFFGLHSGYVFYNISGVRVLFQDKSTKNHRYQVGLREPVFPMVIRGF